MNQSSKRRSIFKAITWRITASFDTFLISYVITGKFSWATAIASIEILTKMILYYGHERIWQKVEWGKED